MYILYSKRANRYVTVYKKEGSLATQSAASLHMVKNSRQQIHSLLQRFPLTNKERQELLPKTEKGSANEGINLFKYAGGCRGCDRMVVGFTTTRAISIYHN